MKSSQTCCFDLLFTALVMVGFPSASALAQALPAPALDELPAARIRIGGVLGERIDANTRAWLLRAPRANPGMLGMFQARDRQPPPDLVDWAGEFAGKYLISAVQAVRLTGDPELERFIAEFVDQLIAWQADDGYLGPFPRNERLLKHWDLWGHYHVMLGLMLWSEHSGDKRPMEACRKIADLICRTYLDAPRRVIDAGSPEMNMAIVHGLTMLHRRTGERKYLKLALEVVKDFEKAGDYQRAGEAGVEFFRTPRPRWESLHAIQGLAELYLATGEERYRNAFLHHWSSILRFDVHNNGSFTSGEQATGDPYALKPAIETCCTIAWQAISIDALRLTGDSTIADELERTTFNAVAAAQHPSGSWWTYNTPMDGVRRASHHDIVFQARPGTPDLNCCSVNGPRGIGSLCQWAIMRSVDGGIAVSFYGPGQSSIKLPGGEEVTILQDTDYPASGRIGLTVGLARPTAFALRLRIPAWSKQVDATLVSSRATELQAKPGSYLRLERTWKDGDRVDLNLDMRLRCEAGDGEAAGRASLFRGPLLLAYDQAFNDFDEADIPRLDAKELEGTSPALEEAAATRKRWVLLSIKGAGGRAVRLCDFASAGAAGTHYRSWLAADHLRPPPPAALEPADGAKVAPGALIFRWRAPAPGATRQHAVIISTSPLLDPVALRFGNATGGRLVLPATQAGKLDPGKTYYWQVIASNAEGETPGIGPARRFSIDPSLPLTADPPDTPFGERASDRVLIQADLAGDVKPSFGGAWTSAGWKAVEDDRAGRAVAFDGKSGLARFEIEAFPEEDYSMSVWVRVDEAPKGLAQIFSAWAGGSDDPLRVCVDGGKLFARIEAGKGYSTEGVALEAGAWHHVAAVKVGARLILYVDGKPAGSAEAPAKVSSHARSVAVAGNPNYTGGPEFLAGRFWSLRLYARALSPDEVRAQFDAGVKRAPAAR